MRYRDIIMEGAFPLKSFKKLFHVGSLDAAHKRRDSHEGAGLSVSLHPEEWQQIARGSVTGSTWELTKPGNKFLDYHRMSKPHRAMIAAWGVNNGFVQSTTVYRVSWFDDEMEEDMTADFTSREEAEEEFQDEFDDEVHTIVEVPGEIMATDLLRHRTNSRAELVMVPDLLATVYAEDALGVDGVWWNDRLDVERYSAPRGVIVPTQVGSWARTKQTKLQESASPPKVAYHITLTRNLKKIMTEGLVPRIGPRSKKLKEPKPAIYLLPSMEHVEDAVSNWLGDQFSEDSQLALLRVAIPPNVEVLSDAGFEMHVYEHIPPSCIEVVSREL